MILELLANSKSVLILGFGREGHSTYRFLRSRYPDLEIILADQKTPENLPEDFTGLKFFGLNYLDSLKIENCKLIIKSPGISPHKPEIVAARANGIVFTSHTQIFFEACPGKTIGVTGTKGKSTTSSLIYHVLHENHLPSVLVGNIGRPALDYLDEITPATWVVMELSSYQLFSTCCSPHIAVLQNIVPDHLDYHTDLAEYVSAKQNLVRFQIESDYFIYNADCKLPRQTTQLTAAQKIPFSLTDFDPAITTQLLGDHNKYNILPSVIIGRLLGLSKENIYSAIASFKPLDTRLQLVGTAKGIRFYADTLATIPEATIAAIEALGPDVTTLIAGGHERKQLYSDLAKKILNSSINTLVLFPVTGVRIEQEINKIINDSPFLSKRGLGGDLKIYHVDNMPSAVNTALDHTASGKICLLSPAAPSFTLFKDYQDEHDQYQTCVLSHSK